MLPTKCIPTFQNGGSIKWLITLAVFQRDELRRICIRFSCQETIMRYQKPSLPLQRQYVWQNPLVVNGTYIARSNYKNGF